MEKHTPMPAHRVYAQFHAAARAAFKFAANETTIQQLSEKRAALLATFGDRPSTAWTFLSAITILAAFGFGTFAAYNAQGAIAGLIDPMGEGLVPPAILLIIGASISFLGMMLGHLIYEKLSQGFHVDDHTGTTHLSPKFWFGVAGLAGAMFYVGFQYHLVQSAGDGHETLASIPLVVAGIAVLELLIGVFLHKALTSLSLLCINILLGIAMRRRKANAKRTYEAYSIYLRFLAIFNYQNPQKKIEKEISNHIRRAIAFYTGAQSPSTNGNHHRNWVQQELFDWQMS